MRKEGKHLGLQVCVVLALSLLAFRAAPIIAQQKGAPGNSLGERQDGKRLFERETFGGNGRTCLTCHSSDTGTVSPRDAMLRFLANPKDPLFVHDGSDDGNGNGVGRMLNDATILVEIPLPANVSLKEDPTARSVTLRRGIPTTLNTPALDPVLMLDGRAANLEDQAEDAIHSHAQNTQDPGKFDLQRIAQFQVTDDFFSSKSVRDFARLGTDLPLPQGNTDSEKRGRVFFEDVPFNPANPKAGACAFCHAGPLLNQMSKFAPPPFQGVRFQNILVSDFNVMQNPVHTFVFTQPDGKKVEITSPDPGRALITGKLDDFDPVFGPLFNSVNAFKISPLRGVAKTAPYFHDNSAKTLEDVMKHYTVLFSFFGVFFTPQDQEDMVNYMKLLD